MAAPEKIEVKNIDLACEKVTKPISLYIEFYPNRIRYHGEFYAQYLKDCEDPLQGYEAEKYNYFDRSIKRVSIVSIAMLWNSASKVYKLSIIVNGHEGAGFDLWIENKKEAISIREKIQKWVFGYDQTDSAGKSAV